MIYAKSSSDEFLMSFDEIFWRSVLLKNIKKLWKILKIFRKSWKSYLWWDFDEIWWVLMSLDEFLMSFDEFRLMSFWWISENIIVLASKHDFRPIGPLMSLDEFLMSFDESWWVLMSFDEFWWVLMSFWWVLMSFGWWVSDEFRKTLLF